MRVSFIILMSVLMLLSACERSDDPGIMEVDIGEEFTARIGIKYKIGDDFSFEITRINDSRCPTGALCFWQGITIISFKIEENEIIEDSVIMGESWSRISNDDYDGLYELRIRDVKPYPDISVNLKPEDYRISVVINRESLFGPTL